MIKFEEDKRAKKNISEEIEGKKERLGGTGGRKGRTQKENENK